MEAADKVVKIWDVENGELIQTLEGHTEGISDVAWSHDGEFLASASDDKTIWIWSIDEVGSDAAVHIESLNQPSLSSSL